MALGAKASNYDYAIHDVNGVVGVKDNVKYPISKEDWKRENPHREHKDRGCTECTFVQDARTLLTFMVSREQKEKATSKPLFVGSFTMLGWTGHSGFYFFRCKKCESVSVDYPHGYTDFGLMFLCCVHCLEKLPFEVTEERAIYEREGVLIPKSTREERMMDFNEAMTSVVKDKDIMVVVASSKNENRPKVGFLKFLREYFDS